MSKVKILLTAQSIHTTHSPNASTQALSLAPSHIFISFHLHLTSVTPCILITLHPLS